MRKVNLVFLFAIILSAIFIIGCDKSTIVDPKSTDDDYLKQQSLTAEELAGFISSEDISIDDGAERDMSYDDFGMMKTTYPITPLKWGRKVDKVTKTQIVNRINDSISVVTIIKDIEGKFIIKAVKDSGDVVDTIKVVKPFTSKIIRKVRFLRVNNDRDVRKNWRPIAITLVEGKTSVKDFSIGTLEVMSSVDTATITDPLTYWARLAPGRGGVATLRPGDSILVRLTVTSTNAKPEFAMLRHGIDNGMSRHRARFRMELVSETGSDGNYTRVYEKKFVARLPLGLALGHYNAIVDVMSYDSINDDVAPFMNAFWGMPYLVKRF